MSETAATLGVPVTFEFRGRPYKVAPRTFHVEAEFSVWVEESALKSILRHEKTLGPTGVALALDGWRKECAAHLYEWDGVSCWQARTSVTGQKHLAALQLHKGGLDLYEAMDLVEEVLDAQAEKEREEREAAKAAGKESPATVYGPWVAMWDAIRRADADPNRERPFRRASRAAG